MARNKKRFAFYSFFFFFSWFPLSHPLYLSLSLSLSHFHSHQINEKKKIGETKKRQIGIHWNRIGAPSVWFPEYTSLCVFKSIIIKCRLRDVAVAIVIVVVVPHFYMLNRCTFCLWLLLLFLMQHFNLHLLIPTWLIDIFHFKSSLLI